MFKRVIIGSFTALALACLSVPVYAGGECAGGAKKSEGAAAMPAAGEKATAEGVGAAVNVGNTICPVSGQKIAAGAMKPATYEYQGKIYNFCCEGCIAAFTQDPEKYIKKVEDELKAAAANTGA